MGHRTSGTAESWRSPGESMRASMLGVTLCESPTPVNFGGRRWCENTSAVAGGRRKHLAGRRRPLRRGAGLGDGADLGWRLAGEAQAVEIAALCAEVPVEHGGGEGHQPVDHRR